MLENKQRLEWLDISKGLGILLIIAAHARIPVVSTIAYFFHVPLFFYLSGRVFKVSKDFFRKRINSLVIPYFLYSLLFAIFSFFDNLAMKIVGLPYDFYSVISLFKSLFIYQNRVTVLWFIDVLFIINVLMFFIDKLNNKKISHIIVLVMFVLSQLFYRLGYKSLYWNLDIVGSALPFFYLGYLMQNNRKQILNDIKLKIENNNTLFTVVFALVCLLFGYLNVKLFGTKLDMFESEYGSIALSYISAFSGIFFICLLSKQIHSKFLIFVGKNSMTFFALHQQIVFVLIGHVLSFFHIFEGQQMIKSMVLTITTILSISVLCLVKERIKENFNN